MAIAFDASSSATGTNDLSWTHTPVGTPKGTLVLVVQGSTIAADTIAGVTYGGVAMTEVALSPNLVDAGIFEGTVYGYFLGSSVPTGAQTVVVDTTATDTRVAAAITVTAVANTEIDDTSSLDSASLDDPSVVLTATTDVFVAGALCSGAGVSVVSPGTNYTQVTEVNTDGGTSSIIRRTANGSAGSVTVDWVTGLAKEAGILAVAIREVAEASAGFTGWGVPL